MATLNDGRALEAAIGGFFEEQGYVVRLNGVHEGRSGGRHEVDVLAEKTDPVTTIKIAVECKDWGKPIEKDIVSKLHYVKNDLGLNQGIVASTAGCRTGAEQAAKELGIVLWGPSELRQFLGSAAVARLETGPAPLREAIGWSFGVEEDVAAKRARAAARGSAILRRQEEVATLRRCWVPAHLVQLTVAQPSQKWGREKLTSRTVANVYDALAGRFLGRVDDAPEHMDLGDAASVEPLIKAAKVAAPIVKAYERARAVTTQAARERHAAALVDLGIPIPCRGVTVDRVELVRLPVWAAILRLRDEERLVAVSGTTGAVSDELSQVLTAHIAHVRPALRPV